MKPGLIMLIMLLLHIIITCISLCAGFLFYEALSRKKTNQFEDRPVIFYLVSGLVSLTLFLQIIVLFTPIDVPVQVAVFIIIAILLMAVKRRFGVFCLHIIGKIKKQPIRFFLGICAYWLLILVLNAGPTMMDDTESYHIQLVKWIKEHGTVPGLVHLHERFGFNSSWFISIAGFIPTNGNINYYTVLNGVLSLWLVAYFVSLILDYRQNKTHLRVAAFIALVVCTISWPMIRGNASTSNYDYITLLVLVVLFTETVKQQKGKTEFALFPEWILWPAYLFTVRISNAPLLILAIFAVAFLWRRGEQKKLIFCIAASALLAFPFLVRNVILSGYAFYPAMYFDWFTVDWKADPGKTKELLRFIKYYNRISTAFYSLDYTESLSFAQWTKAWIKYMFNYDKIVFFPGIAGLLTGAFSLKGKNPLASPVVKLFLLALGLEVITWFLVAPDPRFIYGCLVAGIIIISLVIFSYTGITIKRTWINHGLAALTVMVLGFACMKAFNGTKKGLLTPARLPQPAFRVVKVDNININIPEKILNNWNPRCYATALPCAYEIDPRLRARGENLSDGFRLDRKK